MYTELLALKYKNKLPNLPELRFKSNKSGGCWGEKNQSTCKTPKSGYTSEFYSNIFFDAEAKEEREKGERCRIKPQPTAFVSFPWSAVSSSPKKPLI